MRRKRRGKNRKHVSSTLSAHSTVQIPQCGRGLGGPGDRTRREVPDPRPGSARGWGGGAAVAEVRPMSEILANEASLVCGDDEFPA